MGTVVIGKVESGKCSKGDTLLVMPNRVSYILLLCITYCKGDTLLVMPNRVSYILV